MFLAVPLSLILISIIGIAAIVFRKRTYLSKLYTLNTAGNGGEGISLSPTFSWKKYGADFFPEIKALIDQLEFDKYRGRWLAEVEKFFRRTRVMSLKIDRWSDSIIKKIRRIHVNSAINGSNKETIVVESSSQVETNQLVNQTGSAESGSMSHIFLKNEEERLIIEIAKSPKKGELYEQLGDIYMELGGFIDAKESYEAAIELSPQNESLKLKLSSALEKLNTEKIVTNN